MTRFRSIAAGPVQFRRLIDTYAGFCWQGWVKSKLKEQAAGVFQGAPVEGKTVKLAKGGTKTLTKYDRVRANDLAPEELDALGITDALARVRSANAKANPDIYHPEFTESFEALVALSRPQNNYYANNGVGVSSVMAFLADELATDETTCIQMANRIDDILSGHDPDATRALNQAVRYGWMGRAVADMSCLSNDTFAPSFALGIDDLAIDDYVVRPVLTALRDDLRNGKYNS